MNIHELFFWMQRPFNTEINQDDWTSFLDAFAWEFLLYVAVSAVVMCLIYAVCARRLHFEDLLRPYWPLRLLWLAVASGILVGARSVTLFNSTEALSGKDGWLPAAISSGFFAIAWTITIAWVLFYLVTPAPFKSRLVRWWLAWKASRLVNKHNQ